MLLKGCLPGSEIWHRARPRHCSVDVLDELRLFTESLEFFDWIVVQVGIADSTPRPYPRWFYQLMQIVVSPTRLRSIERFTHKYLLWVYNRQWVSRARFGATIEQIIEETHAANPRAGLVFISIAAPTKTVLALLPGLKKSAAEFNDTLEAVVQRLSGSRSCHFVDPYREADPLEVTIGDGHHLSCVGHRLVASAVFSAMSANGPVGSKA
jgi:lysophospholipase L1-like esterase